MQKSISLQLVSEHSRCLISGKITRRLPSFSFETKRPQFTPIGCLAWEFGTCPCIGQPQRNASSAMQLQFSASDALNSTVVCTESRMQLHGMQGYGMNIPVSKAEASRSFKHNCLYIFNYNLIIE